jgi:hypothetical protein
MTKREDVMEIRSRRVSAIACGIMGLCIGAVLAPLGKTQAQDVATMRRGAEIHVAVKAAGIAVDTVEWRGGRYEVVLSPGSQGRQAEADRIREEVLARVDRPVVPQTLQDALVVLQFEPTNESARRLVRERYDQLRGQTGQ